MFQYYLTMWYTALYISCEVNKSILFHHKSIISLINNWSVDTFGRLFSYVSNKPYSLIISSTIDWNKKKMYTKNFAWNDLRRQLSECNSLVFLPAVHLLHILVVFRLPLTKWQMILNLANTEFLLWNLKWHFMRSVTPITWILWYLIISSTNS